MKSYAAKIKVLVLGDEPTSRALYLRFLKSRFENIEQRGFESIEDFLHLYEFDLIFIDINEAVSIDKLKSFEKSRAFRPKTVLLSPFLSGELKHKIDDISFLDMILTKPVSPSKLEEVLKNFTVEVINHYILKKTNDVMVDFFNLSPFLLGIYQLDGKLFFANKQYLEQSGKTESQMSGTLYFDEVAQCERNFDYIKSRLLLSGKPFSIDTQQEESATWYRSHFYLLKKNFIVHKIDDITEEVQSQERLKQAAIFFDNAKEGIVVTDEYGFILAVNEAFSSITGYTTEEVIGKNPSILRSGIHDDVFYTNMWESLSQNGNWQGEIWNRRKNGEVFPEWLSISKVEDKKSLSRNFFIAIFTDITDVKERDKKVHYYANYDHLTGLANRLNVDSRFEHSLQIARRRKEKVAIIFADIDNFKDINDTYGHSIGDAVIKEVGVRISQSIRQEDTLGRIGGDEFLMVIGDLHSDEDVRILCDKILASVSQAMKIQSHVFYVTLSLGVALYPDHGKKSEMLKKNADLAMYKAKEAGKNTYAMFELEYSQAKEQEVTVLSELRDAIKLEQLRVYYQPVIDYKRDKVLSAEALVRWAHPSKGLIAPGEFVQIAEEKGLIKELTTEVIYQVLNDLENINSTLNFDENFKVAVNISAKLFFSKGFVEWIKGLFHGYSIGFSQIELELTETQLMRNHEVAGKLIQELKETGFKIALDDFGTGYSSLSYLKFFAIDTLKIDKSFILDAPFEEDDRKIVKAIVDMAKTFNLLVHAEGVEETVHEEVVKSLGCDLGQGFLYAKPLEYKEFYERLKNNNFI